MIGRRQFLGSLPALVAGLTALRTIPPVEPLRVRHDAFELLKWDDNDGTHLNSYAGISRDPYEAYLTYRVEFHTTRPHDSFELL